MKAIHPAIAVFFLIISVSLTSKAQEAGYTTANGMTIGFGLGGSYQVSDIRNSTGAGFDFNLGSYLYKRQGAALAVDWKFRFLAGENRAHDDRINPDDTYSNIQLRHFNYDLEIGLTLNRLMERTRIVLTAFAGAGISHGITHTDFLDSSGDPYDYSVINNDQTRSQIKADLLALSDNDYETALSNKAALMPTAGIYLGYQFSRSFSMGIIHKINFSLTENNSAFGINMDGYVDSRSFIDMNHYTSLGFRWILGRAMPAGTARTSTGYISPVQDTRREITADRPGGIMSRPPSLPEVNITIPYYEIYRTAERDIDVTARVRRVGSRDNIIVELDNESMDFEFDPQTMRVSIPALMTRDTSLLTIRVSNESGFAGDSLLLIFTEPATVIPEQEKKLPVYERDTLRAYDDTRTNIFINRNEIRRENETGRIVRERRDERIKVEDPAGMNPPVVRFINPVSPLTVRDNIFSLRVETQNVESWDDVDVLINRVKNHNFSFTREGLISLNIGLTEGVNTIEVSGENSAGRVTEKTSINYEKPSPVNIEQQQQQNQQQQQHQQQQQQNQEQQQHQQQQGFGEQAGEASGIRINPGNSDWQFCLVTPGGTYNRDNLSNSNFTYSGPATSLYIMPIAGSGTATVNGKPYEVRSGQYYLFTGNMSVTVSTRNPGSMGQWSVIINAGREPSTGRGNRRPKSPCEGEGGNNR